MRNWTIVLIEPYMGVYAFGPFKYKELELALKKLKANVSPSHNATWRMIEMEELDD